MKKLWLSIALITLTLGLSGCTTKKESTLSFPQKEFFQLHKELFVPKISLTGAIEAKKSVSLASKVSGRIQTLFVDVGDTVHKGDLLAQFSVTDDQARIAYSNAVNQLRTTKISTQSAIQSAETAVLNAQQQHEQAKRQEEANMKQLLDTLDARTNSSHTLLKRVLSFLDMTLGISPQYQYGGGSNLVVSVGSNDTIQKQKIKNAIDSFLQKKEEESFPYFQDSLKNAHTELERQKELEKITQDFYTLVRNTPLTGNFPREQRDSLKQTIEQFLSELSGDILALESQMRATETAREQLDLGLIQTENEVKNAQSQLDVVQARAQQQIQLVQNQISSTQNIQNELELRAPFDGIITQRFKEEGSLVAAGNPLFELANRSLLKIKTDVPDIQSGFLTKGMAVEITIDGISGVFQGEISRINPAVDPSTRTLGIEITLNESPEQIKIGMFARATIILPARTTFFIPKRYISADFSGSFVTTKDGKQIAVQKGTEKQGLVEILSDDLHDGMLLQTSTL